MVVFSVKRYKILFFVFLLVFGAFLTQKTALANSQTDYYNLKSGRNGYFQHSAVSDDYLYFLSAGGYNNSLNSSYGTTTTEGIPYWDNYPASIFRQRQGTDGFNSIFPKPFKMFVLTNCNYNSELILITNNYENIYHHIVASSSDVSYTGFQLCWFAFETATRTNEVIKHMYINNNVGGHWTAFNTFIILISQENDFYNFSDFWDFLISEINNEQAINNFIYLASWGTSTPPTGEPEADYCRNLNFAVRPFCDMLVWLFVPSSDTLNNFAELGDTIKYKPPFGYFFAYYEAYSNMTTSTPPFTLASVQAIQDSIFSPIRTGLIYIFWFFFGLWVIYYISHRVNI